MRFACVQRSPGLDFQPPDSAPDDNWEKGIETVLKGPAAAAGRENFGLAGTQCGLCPVFFIRPGYIQESVKLADTPVSCPRCRAGKDQPVRGSR